jgi:hypothetical protein
MSDGLAMAHLFALGLWGGLAGAEVVIEATARDAESRRVAARLHHRLDLLLEAPILVVILATGALLATRVTLTPLLWLKIGCGLAAITANVVCIALVIARRRAIDDDARVARLSGAILWTGAGIPPALVALVLGFMR